MSSLLLKRVPPGAKQRCLDIERVVHALEELPDDKSWRVSIEEIKSERSLQQNAYLWCAYGKISKVTGYEKLDIHEYVLKCHFGTRLKKVPPDRDHPNGLKEVPLRTTTTNEFGRRSVLGKVQFMELVEFVKRYAAEAGVYVADPDEHVLEAAA